MKELKCAMVMDNKVAAVPFTCDDGQKHAIMIHIDNSKAEVIKQLRIIADDLDGIPTSPDFDKENPFGFDRTKH